MMDALRVLVGQTGLPQGKEVGVDTADSAGGERVLGRRRSVPRLEVRTWPAEGDL
jgi:hypothetical protein